MSTSASTPDELRQELRDLRRDRWDFDDAIREVLGELGEEARRDITNDALLGTLRFFAAEYGESQRLQAHIDELRTLVIARPEQRDPITTCFPHGTPLTEPCVKCQRGEP